MDLQKMSIVYLYFILHVQFYIHVLVLACQHRMIHCEIQYLECCCEIQYLECCYEIQYLECCCEIQYLECCCEIQYLECCCEIQYQECLLVSNEYLGCFHSHCCHFGKLGDENSHHWRSLLLQMLRMVILEKNTKKH